MNRKAFFIRLGPAMAAAGVSLPMLARSQTQRKQARPSGKPRIRIGQIGTGHAHAAGKMISLRRSPDFEVVGLAEPDPGRRRRAEQHRTYRGLRFFTEEQLLNVEGLQAVTAETEVKDLLPTAARVIAAGKHLHLDKPAGESLTWFREILAEASRRQLTVQMGYMFRYNPAFQFCFQAVRKGWLGRVFAIEAAIGKTVGAESRHLLARYPGGTMFELGCHLLDAVIYLLGKPDRVSPFNRRSGDYDDNLLDNQLAVLEYPRAVATVRSALIEVEGGRRRQFVVCGDEGTCDIRPLEPPHLRLALSQVRGQYQKGYQDVSLPNRPRYDADFIDLAQVIRNEKAFEYPPEHDLAVQETVLRASGLPVEIQ